MTIRFSKHFLRNYFKAPKAVQKAFDKQSEFLLQDFHHPSGVSAQDVGKRRDEEAGRAAGRIADALARLRLHQSNDQVNDASPAFVVNCA
jgi:hypothetical protein